MLRRTLCLLKQTVNPPKKHLPLEVNPLTRWSRQLPRWCELSTGSKPHLDQLSVGVEGCHAAFNATNAIRACLFFGTQQPPTFLTLPNWRSIAYAQARGGAGASKDSTITPTAESSVEDTTATTTAEASVKSNIEEQDAQWSDVALFGEENFLASGADTAPLVVLENFTPRSQSIFTRRFPHRSRLVVGHENQGVSHKYIMGPDGESTDKAKDSQSHTKAESVLYIPQYGTISSLNVVTSMGIALFYAFLDEHFPNSRRLSTVSSNAKTESHSAMEAALRRYQACFMAPLPTSDSSAEMHVSEKAKADPGGNRTPRLDLRPLHPNYFKKDVAEIQAAHKAYRQSLLSVSNDSLPQQQDDTGKALRARSRFGLSVLYENDYDHRNFGGLIRNANAFLVDHVFYLGKRRYNVVGSVGSYHYTPPTYMGRTFEDALKPNLSAQAKGTSEQMVAGDDAEQSSEEENLANAKYESMIKSVIAEQSAAASKNGAKLSDHQERIIKLSLWSLHTRSKIEKACGGRTRFWFLDCGHRNLYAEDFGLLRQLQKEGLQMTPEDARYKSSLESMIWYMTHCSEEDFVLSLCDTEEKLFDAAGDGVVLLVPQEGKLPHISLLMQCEKILTVVPDDVRSVGQDQDVLTMRGLPSQVASGIALQRLSAVMHPRLKDL